ncbi:UNVERIFIED_CONTAM: hypothetical protein K2H54_023665 [Gekko kuhli]
MERSLCSPPKNGWEKVNQNQVFELLHTVLCTLTAAMRYEPANSHFFRTEIQYEKLADAVRLLGCFSDSRKISPLNIFPSNTQPFQRLLEDDLISMDSVSPTLRHCSKLFIYLYKVTTDSFDRSVSVAKQFEKRRLLLPTLQWPGASQVPRGTLVSFLVEQAKSLVVRWCPQVTARSGKEPVLHGDQIQKTGLLVVRNRSLLA